ncbi:MAG: hypothetical protein PHU23_12415 [Dehalococcoidales bacterium]|nr:hypothetical protein [Dehalococcoidales bacterium]
MTNKMKLLMGLGVLGIVLLAGGIWFLLDSNEQVQGLEIIVLPAPGNVLYNSQNESSEVLLKNIQVKRSISDKQYIFPWLPEKIEPDDQILVVSGSIQNNHPDYKEIGMYAEGYDEAEKQVSWTLDAAHIAGQIGLHLENGESGQFTLHMNFTNDLNSIRIYASNYPFTPP